MKCSAMGSARTTVMHNSGAMRKNILVGCVLKLKNIRMIRKIRQNVPFGLDNGTALGGPCPLDKGFCDCHRRPVTIQHTAKRNKNRGRTRMEKFHQILRHGPVFSRFRNVQKSANLVIVLSIGLLPANRLAHRQKIQLWRCPSILYNVIYWSKVLTLSESVECGATPPVNQVTAEFPPQRV